LKIPLLPSAKLPEGCQNNFKTFLRGLPHYHAKGQAFCAVPLNKKKSKFKTKMQRTVLKATKDSPS
jgi:hypothetical protein